MSDPEIIVLDKFKEQSTTISELIYETGIII
jgi:hypothetical protein